MLDSSSEADEQVLQNLQEFVGRVPCVEIASERRDDGGFVVELEFGGPAEGRVEAVRAMREYLSTHEWFNPHATRQNDNPWVVTYPRPDGD